MSLATAATFATVLWQMDQAANADEPDVIGGSNNLVDTSHNLGTGSTIYGRTATRSAVTSSSNHFVANSHADFTLGDVSFSMRMLLRFNSVAANQGLVTVNNASDCAFKVYFVTGSPGIIECDIFNAAGGAGAGFVDTTGFGTISTGTNYHLVVSYNAATDTLALYLNNTAFTGSHSGGAYFNAASFYIGRNTINNFNADMSVSEVIFVNGYALSDADVTADFNSGSPLAFSSWPSQTDPSVAPRSVTARREVHWAEVYERVRRQPRPGIEEAPLSRRARRARRQWAMAG